MSATRCLTGQVALTWMRREAQQWCPDTRPCTWVWRRCDDWESTLYWVSYDQRSAMRCALLPSVWFDRLAPAPQFDSGGVLMTEDANQYYGEWKDYASSVEAVYAAVQAWEAMSEEEQVHVELAASARLGPFILSGVL